MTPLEQYVVRFAADMDKSSFDEAKVGIDKFIASMERLNGMSFPKALLGTLEKLKGMAPHAALLSALTSATKATTALIKGTADTEMQYKRLGVQMWTTTDSAKALSVAMKTMGVSEQDIAWVPELREQFFRLRNEINELATPEDAPEQLRWIRDIGYDIQSLQVKLKALREWITYYLIKYLEPIIKEVRGFIDWLNRKLGSQMPEIAQKLAKVISDIVGVAYSAFVALKGVIGAVYDFVDALPENVKKWAAVFAVVGAAITAGPFGKLIMILGSALLLIQDFVYYTKGWNSSKTLAPMWAKLLEFLNSKKLQNLKETWTTVLEKFAGMLDTILGKLKEIGELISGGIDWDVVKDEWSDAVNSLADAFSELYKAVEKLFGSMDEHMDNTHLNQQRSFWQVVAKCIQGAIGSAANFTGLMARIVKALAQVLQGDIKGAGLTLIDAGEHIIKSGVKGIGITPGVSGAASLGSSIGAGIRVWFSKTIGGGADDNLAAMLRDGHEDGYKWVETQDGDEIGNTGNSDPGVQCASWATTMMNRIGKVVMPHMNNEILVENELASKNAYHDVGTYEPEKGDFVFYHDHHMGIYIGGGKMMHRGSSGGVTDIDIDEPTLTRWTGPVTGWGSWREYAAYTNQTAAYNAPSFGSLGLVGATTGDNSPSGGFFGANFANSYAASVDTTQPLTRSGLGGDFSKQEVTIGAISINISESTQGVHPNEMPKDLEIRLDARVGRGVFV